MNQRTVVGIALGAAGALLLVALLVVRLGGGSAPGGAGPGVAEPAPGATAHGTVAEAAAAEPSTTTAAAAAPTPGPAVGPRPTPVPAPTAGAQQAAGPGRVRMPAIGVDAAVVPVGVQADGDMEVPPATEVGWYRFGPAPGAAGSAVLAAHVDYDGVRGAFFRLRDLRAGDRIEVTAADGAPRPFTVTSVERYPKDALPEDRVFARAGRPSLAMITCGGEFDRSARSYRDNVVAFAEPLG